MFKHLNTRIPKRIEQDKEKVSAVLIPLIKKDGRYHILFEIRSNKLSHQPGEICFPGGKREALETSLQTAIRETCEELLISESDIQVYGPLDYFLSPAGIRIDAYLGELKNYNGQYSICLLYTSDAADEEDSVDFGGCRIIKKKKQKKKKAYR